jgi:hypothetical protein
MFIFKNFIGFQSRLSRDSVDWSLIQSRLKFFQSTPVDSVVYASLLRIVGNFNFFCDSKFLLNFSKYEFQLIPCPVLASLKFLLVFSRDSVDWSLTQSRLKFFQSTPVDSVVYASLQKVHKFQL